MGAYSFWDGGLTMGARTFEDRAAVRESTPLLVGLIGPSGSGKTYSALRLATGIRKVVGGEIFVIDTESRRSLHYAKAFSFRHVAFGAPFSPLDYLAAIDHCVKRGAKTIVIDSMSHEHEGPGGVLEMHDQEVKRLAALWKKPESAATMAGWTKPKSERRRLINSILQINCNFVFCFRAKEKLRIEVGKDPVPLGFCPQAGEDFVYELTLKCLLLPGANGVPTLASDYPGERQMIKIPGQFRQLFNTAKQIDESLGEALAQWAKGDSAETPLPSVEELLLAYVACSDSATFRALEEQRRKIWGNAGKANQALLKAESEATSARIAQASDAPEEPKAPEAPEAPSTDDSQAQG